MPFKVWRNKRKKAVQVGRLREDNTAVLFFGRTETRTCVFVVPTMWHEQEPTGALKLQGRSLAWGLQLPEQQVVCSLGIQNNPTPTGVCVCVF